MAAEHSVSGAFEGLRRHRQATLRTLEPGKTAGKRQQNAACEYNSLLLPFSCRLLGPSISHEAKMASRLAQLGPRKEDERGQWEAEKGRKQVGIRKSGLSREKLAMIRLRRCSTAEIMKMKATWGQHEVKMWSRWAKMRPRCAKMRPRWGQHEPR